MGTNNKTPNPKKKTIFLSFGRAISASFFLGGAIIFSLPFIFHAIINVGIAMHTKLGKKVLIIIFQVVTCPPIHSIVVVTSPIGLQAPPAFAEIITRPANNHLCFLSSTSFLKRDTITIVVVRLSNAAERKKVIREILQTSLTVLLVCILSIIIWKPS